MANPFDQFDEPSSSINPFDQFDEPSFDSSSFDQFEGSNPFDKFDYESADPSSGDIVKGVGAEVLSGGAGAVAGGLIGGTLGSVVPVLGTAAGAVVGSSLGGFAGGFLGSLWAQDIEGQEDKSMGRALAAGTVSAIPFGGAGAKAITGATKITGRMVAGAAGREAVKGGVLGGTEATIAKAIDEDRLPTKEEYAAYVGGGTLFGGALGAASPKIGKSMDKFFGKTGEDIDRAIATGEIEYKDIENWTLATSKDTPEAGSRKLRTNIISGLNENKDFNEYVFHRGFFQEDIIKSGLKAGGFQKGTPIDDKGYGDIVYVFRRSDFPKDFDGSDVRYLTNKKDIKPVTAFQVEALDAKVREDLDQLGFRAEEQGDYLEPSWDDKRFLLS